MILLKTSQRLGYFPKLEEVPAQIVNYIRDRMKLPVETVPGYDKPRTRYQHQTAIRKFRGIQSYGKEAQRIALETVQKAAQVMDHPADLINVAIAELVRQNYELPAFSTLDRLARHIRKSVNDGFFEMVFQRLGIQEIKRLDELLERGESHYSEYNRLKNLPKKSRLSEIRERLDHLAWLTTFGDAKPYLEGIPPAKVSHFAAQAKALDAREMKDFSQDKRATLLLCLIYRAQTKTRDHFGTLFIKRMASLHKAAKEELERIREQHREKTGSLVLAFTEVLQALQDHPEDAEAGRLVKEVLASRGSIPDLLVDCEAVASCQGNNYLPLILKFFRHNHRPVLFRLINALRLDSTSEDGRLIRALEFVKEHQNSRREWLPDEVDLSFASDAWRRTIRVKQRVGGYQIARRHLEVCVFSYMATELKTGDICIQDSDDFADYREQLLSWEECQPLLSEYLDEMDFPKQGKEFVQQLQEWMNHTCRTVDHKYPDSDAVVINEKGEPELKKIRTKERTVDQKHLEKLVLERMPERSILDILCNVEHWIGWTRHFGPLSGSDPKLEMPTERYILNTFTYGCNLGPAQAARHMRGQVTPKMLSFVNQRHVTAQKLDQAIKDTINEYYRFDLPQLWGSGKTAAADGTKYDIYEENLLAEYHIRYGGYGGIAYHHVSDNYIALFSHFIPCGVWEAVYILDGLLKNKSDIQPDTVHADTQGQSTPVFALAHLLGIKLMPRIRNLKDLMFFRPFESVRYKHIDILFTETINWKLIETHWKDLLQVVLSIKAGKISSATLLRKLGNDSRKNRLYKAFRELGRVVRTVFLLEYISNLEFRQQITATTNKAEAYNGFSKWLFFGGESIIADNDPEEQEKVIKYNDLVANAVILQNVVDLTAVLRELTREGYGIESEAVAALSPYMTSHIKRFGDYVIDMDNAPEPPEPQLILPLGL
ncbi:Transposase and inactivated derivatives, TnpA family [Laceyella tengchongensis]|uniref:Transposase and inactivated derivatives, TnpA family n=1 Tax=Laceyella tengchongensis TaxID=574699 RepID=A0AA46AFA4_9BACL|nr:Transposase and inactivated derivatives, TnpA family [Laceyella tengchongensis]